VSTRVLWYHAGGGALSYWSPATGRWTLRGGVDDVGYYRTGANDPKRKRYLGVGQGHVESWSIDALGPDHLEAAHERGSDIVEAIDEDVLVDSANDDEHVEAGHVAKAAVGAIAVRGAQTLVVRARV